MRMIATAMKIGISIGVATCAYTATLVTVCELCEIANNMLNKEIKNDNVKEENETE